MKRYLLLFLTIATLLSCNDNEDDYHFEYIPVVSADVPSEFTHGQTYRLKVTYQIPNSCFSIYSYDYLYNDTERMIAPIALANDSQTCDDNSYEGVFHINVEALQTEPYIFKFWQGIDAQGDPIYLIIEVPVI